MKKMLIALLGAASLSGIGAAPASAACQQGDVKCATGEVVELVRHATWQLLGDRLP